MFCNALRGVLLAVPCIVGDGRKVGSTIFVNDVAGVVTNYSLVKPEPVFRSARI